MLVNGIIFSLQNFQNDHHHHCHLQRHSITPSILMFGTWCRPICTQAESEVPPPPPQQIIKHSSKGKKMRFIDNWTVWGNVYIACFLIVVTWARRRDQPFCLCHLNPWKMFWYLLNCSQLSWLWKWEKFLPTPGVKPESFSLYVAVSEYIYICNITLTFKRPKIVWNS